MKIINMKQSESVLLNLLNDTFEKSTIDQIEKNYLNNLLSVSKWMCFSDYCLDDEGKPNDVITFSIIPHITDYDIIENYIQTNAKTDIKKTRNVKETFVSFLRKYPMINFSFILNDRKKLLGNNHKELLGNLRNQYIFMKEMYEQWMKNEPHKKKEYTDYINKINQCLSLIEADKKIKLLLDMILIPFLGAYVSSIILKRINKVEVFGWFSDRDKLNDIGDGLSLYIFHHQLHNLMNGKNFTFASTVANSTSKIFYDELIKIPDYIAGTLADYNLEDNTISKDKFNEVLIGYISNNSYNNHIFRIYKKNHSFNCDKVVVQKK